MDPVNVRALFYYFTESPEDASTKPLVLWLNRGISHFTLVNGPGLGIGIERLPFIYCLDLGIGIERIMNFTKDMYMSILVIGNALIDHETYTSGSDDFYWTHALIPDEIHQGIISNCNFTPGVPDSPACDNYQNQAGDAMGDVYRYDIYAPYCASTPSPNPYSDVGFDPCSDNYIHSYLNLPQVQKALHANVTGLPYPWTNCSGDVDGVVPVTSTRYSINAMTLTIETPWYPWYTQKEVGGYVVGYQGLAFVTVRFSGHFVPRYQPARALTVFSSFLQGKLPPSS
ncbi:hypothetical protein MRB53_015219 [Persea americana]|uniref:Uncharacterized protein n=1 Tax=Persea americana TaxID=3435 RepID=A0ACC2KDP2_PERAE|nr:hypothetical protein MRB53_015219 [Persea americana]